jgi:iron complex outermembrane receptor protein
MRFLLLVHFLNIFSSKVHQPGHALLKSFRFILHSATLLTIVSLQSRAICQDPPPLLSFPDTTSSSTKAFDSTISLKEDSLREKMADTAMTSIPDTLGRMSTPSLVGTYDRSLDSTRVLTQSNLRWLDYRYLGGILETVPGVYVREQFSEGQHSQLNIRGQDWRSIAITTNGRLMNDPASGVYNVFYFTPEYADRIEIVTGPRAFLYGLNASGGAINLVTKNYNSNRPFTKINYSETAYGYQFSDGTFSQNISRKVNFTFGFQHQGTDGRFPNSADDRWNMRVKVRYNLSKKFNIILSEYLTHTETGLNGGGDPSIARTADAFNRISAIVRNTDSYEKMTRHDVDLSFVGTVFNDTTNVSMLTFYYSNALREYRDEEAGRQRPNGIFIHSDHRSSWMGALFTQNVDTKFQRFSFGSNAEIRQIEGSPNIGRRRKVIKSSWAKEELLLGDALTIAGFARYDRYLGENHFGLGADATLTLAEHLMLFGGLSISKRVPTYQELYWSDSTVGRSNSLVPERHRQLEVGARLRFGDALDLRTAFFYRTIEDAIEVLPYGSGFVFPGVFFTNIDKVTMNGVEAKLAARLWVLYLDGVATYIIKNSNGARDRHLPELSGNGGVYYWSKLLNDDLELKVGLRGRFITSQEPTAFNPEVVAYVQQPGAGFWRGSSVDFFLIAHIGDAYIHLMWENLTNAEYYVTPYYPVLDRAFRLAVSWEFLN